MINYFTILNLPCKANLSNKSIESAYVAAQIEKFHDTELQKLLNEAYLNLNNITKRIEHIFYILIVALPSIGVWVLGIPLIGLLILRKNKRVFDLMGKQEITKAENDEIFQLK